MSTLQVLAGAFSVGAMVTGMILVTTAKVENEPIPPAGPVLLGLGLLAVAFTAAFFVNHHSRR